LGALIVFRKNNNISITTIYKQMNENNILNLNLFDFKNLIYLKELQVRIGVARDNFRIRF
jgi:hypothetical protein